MLKIRTKGVSITISQNRLTINRLQNNDQECSDGKQEEMNTLNYFPERGGVAHHTHTNGKHLG